uniref:Uncharacterized protein n=1 Tax=Arundo donax TaxID=35708 RepID=A0A0A9HEX9_ARUDO
MSSLRQTHSRSNSSEGDEHTRLCTMPQQSLHLSLVGFPKLVVSLELVLDPYKNLGGFLCGSTNLHRLNLLKHLRSDKIANFKSGGRSR